MNFNLNWLFFNFKYFNKPPWDTGITPPELIDFITKHSPGRALDLGCGTGVNLLTLAQAGWQVAGVDFAWLAAWRARKRLKAAGYNTAHVFTGDVTTQRNWVEPFDLVLDIGCYHSLPKAAKNKYQDNLRSMLAPGGYFLLYGFVLGSVGQIGIDEKDIAALSEDMALVEREQGADRDRASLWLTFNKNTTGREKG